MRVTLDLYRNADGRLVGTVHAAAGSGGAFTSLLDLLRVLDGLDLPARTSTEDAATGDRTDDRTDDDEEPT